MADVTDLADQLRMYSWATLAVTVCALGALEVRERAEAGERP